MFACTTVTVGARPSRAWSGGIASPGMTIAGSIETWGPTTEIVACAGCWTASSAHHIEIGAKLRKGRRIELTRRLRENFVR